MKVGYLLRYYPTLTETFVYLEIEGLLQRGMSVEIFALGAREDGDLQERLPKCPVHRAPRGRIRRWLPLQSLGERWLGQHQRRKDVARLSWLKQATAHLDFLWVHFAGEAAELAYALHLDTQLPYGVTAHAVDIFSPRPAWTTVLKKAHSVITISTYNQQYLLARGITSDVIHCGVRLADWTVDPLTGGPLRALFVGRDVAKKGLGVLLEAFAHLSEEHQLRVISNRTETSTNNVSFLPFLKTSALNEQYAWSNVVVLPCTTAENGDRDGIPVVLMEALACGRPVITTTLPGIEQLISSRVGWLARSGCRHSLVECLLEAAQPAKRAEKAMYALSHLRNSPFVHFKQMEQFVHHLVTRF